MDVIYALVLLYALLVKHAVADLWIQSSRKPGDKCDFKDPKGYLHAMDHAIGTFLVVWGLTFDIRDAIVVALVDFVLHYWIDFFKSLTVKKFKLTTEHTKFWALQACDQILHYATYLGITVALI